MTEAPRRPVLIVPGFMSSALHVQTSAVVPRWQGKRLWLNLARLGITGRVRGHVGEVATNDDEAARSVKVRNDWVRHMALAPNLLSEQEGVEVRAVPGLEGVGFLDTSPLGAASWVFAPVIKVLVKAGYIPGHDLDAAPYDWRLAPAMLEARDGYFTRTMDRIEAMAVATGRPVTLLCHSMGGVCAHYMLSLALQERGQDWIDKHVDGMVLAAAGILGSPQALRSIIVGTNMGLPKSFLPSHAALLMARSFGSTPWLFPRSPKGEVEMHTGALGAPGVRQEGLLRVTLAGLDVEFRRSHKVRLQLEVTGATPFMTDWFDVDPEGVTQLSSGDAGDMLVIEVGGPSRLAEAVDMDIVFTVFEQRVVTKNILHSLGKRVPGVLRRGMREAYEHTIGPLERLGGGHPVFRKATKLSDMLPLDYEEGKTEIMQVVMPSVRPDPGRAVLACALSFYGRDGLHAQRRVPPPPLPAGSSPKQPSHCLYPPVHALRLEELDTIADLWQSSFHEQDPFLRPQDPPPVRQVVAIFGVNVPTEVRCMLRRGTRECSANRLESDHVIDEDAPLREEDRRLGRTVRNGIVFETKWTPQDVAGRTVLRSGDGVVPYGSLSYVHSWANSCHVTVHELEGVQHRGILDDDDFHRRLLDHCLLETAAPSEVENRAGAEAAAEAAAEAGADGSASGPSGVGAAGATPRPKRPLPPVPAAPKPDRPHGAAIVTFVAALGPPVPNTVPYPLACPPVPPPRPPPRPPTPPSSPPLLPQATQHGPRAGQEEEALALDLATSRRREEEQVL